MPGDELTPDEQAVMDQQGADAIAEQEEFADPAPIDADVAVTATVHSILDDEQFLVRYTLSDGRIFRQFCINDDQAAAWAVEYRDAAVAAGLTLASWAKA